MLLYIEHQDCRGWRRFLEVYAISLLTFEESARGIVTLFVQLVCDALQNKYPDQTFFVDHECDVLHIFGCGALIVVSAGRSTLDVVFSLEYKPKVSPNLKDKCPCHISELFLQVFYLATYSKHAIVHCPTDLEDYHMFSLEKVVIHTAVLVQIKVLNPWRSVALL